ncbi:MAG: DUF6552 family protein [Roseovarius sp.]
MRSSPAPRFDRAVFVVKWGASIIQIMGYSVTGFGWTPWNLYLRPLYDTVPAPG